VAGGKGGRGFEDGVGVVRIVVEEDFNFSARGVPVVRQGFNHILWYSRGEVTTIC
jgi:hypothetical protein